MHDKIANKCVHSQLTSISLRIVCNTYETAKIQIFPKKYNNP